MQSKPIAIKKLAYRRRPIAPLIAIDQPGRLRFAHLMALLGMSHQTIYQKIKCGELPPPDGYDGPRPYWFTATIRPLLERCASVPWADDQGDQENSGTPGLASK